MTVGYKLLDSEGNNISYENFQHWYQQQVSYPVVIESVTGTKEGDLAILVRVDKTKPGPRL
jgi:hypothetical protein